MNLVRAELLKIRTTSLWWVFTILLLPLWAFSLFINKAATSDDDPVGLAVTFYTNGQFAGILIVLLLGAIVVTNEFFHLTATTTFLTTPRRDRVILAKFAAAVVISLVVWAGLTVLNLVFAPLVMSGHDLTGQLGESAVWQAIGLNALAFALWAVLGVGCGVLIRSQLATTLTLAILYVVGAPVATGIFVVLGLDRLDFLVPTVASDIMIGGQLLPEGPGRLTGAVVLVTYAAVTGIVGTLIMRQRDIG